MPLDFAEIDCNSKLGQNRLRSSGNYTSSDDVEFCTGRRFEAEAYLLAGRRAGILRESPVDSVLRCGDITSSNVALSKFGTRLAMRSYNSSLSLLQGLSDCLQTEELQWILVSIGMHSTLFSLHVAQTFKTTTVKK